MATIWPVSYTHLDVYKRQGFESDLEVLAAHPHPEDGFAGMEIRGDLLTDKENAGAALLDACKEVKTSDPVQIGSYRGYAMSVEFSAWKQEYTLLLKGQMTHRATPVSYTHLAEPAAGEIPGQVRKDEENLPEGTPSHPLQPDATEREAVPAPSGDRRDRPEQTGADDALSLIHISRTPGKRTRS